MTNQYEVSKEAFMMLLAVAQAQAAMRSIPLPDIDNREYIRSLMDEQAKKLDPVKKYLLRISSNNVVLKAED